MMSPVVDCISMPEELNSELESARQKIRIRVKEIRKTTLEEKSK